jgi:hypothetical protein
MCSTSHYQELIPVTGEGFEAESKLVAERRILNGYELATFGPRPVDFRHPPGSFGNWLLGLRRPPSVIRHTL